MKKKKLTAQEIVASHLSNTRLFDRLLLAYAEWQPDYLAELELSVGHHFWDNNPCFEQFLSEAADASELLSLWKLLDDNGIGIRPSTFEFYSWRKTEEPPSCSDIQGEK